MQAMSPIPLWSVREADSPVVAVAVHGGHHLRDEVAALMKLDGRTRLREEDPFTDAWTSVAPTELVACRSRFEVDLNRPRDGAVYREPGEAWDLDVWRDPPAADFVERSLEIYDAFYDLLEGMLTRAVRIHGGFVVLDIHSYNHRRGGPGAPVDDPTANPDVNVGTTALDRDRWAPLVDGFLDDLRAYEFPGRSLDVGENVRFGGGHLSRWVAERFAGSGCALAVEIKKFFMDEHDGVVDPRCHAAVRDLLASTIPGLAARVAAE